MKRKIADNWPRAGDVWIANDDLLDPVYEIYAKVVVDKVYMPLGSNGNMIRFLLLDGSPITWEAVEFISRFNKLDP